VRVGLIGAGNMAAALARGWGLPVLCHDPVRERAQALAQAYGGEALPSNRAVAERADLVVLAHKPAQLEEVAAEIGPAAKAVASILALTPLERLKAVYPNRPVYRFMPSLGAAVRAGTLLKAQDEPQEEGLDREVTALFGRLGRLVVLPDGLLDCGMAVMSCAPAYLALVVEAQVDAAVRRGLPPAQAGELAIGALEATAALLRERAGDTLALRRAVSSPGGATARGLDALERGGVRAAFSAALDAALGDR